MLFIYLVTCLLPPSLECKLCESKDFVFSVGLGFDHCLYPEFLEWCRTQRSHSISILKTELWWLMAGEVKFELSTAISSICLPTELVAMEIWKPKVSNSSSHRFVPDSFLWILGCFRLGKRHLPVWLTDCIGARLWILASQSMVCPPAAVASPWAR